MAISLQYTGFLHCRFNFNWMEFFLVNMQQKYYREHYEGDNMNKSVMCSAFWELTKENI